MVTKCILLSISSEKKNQEWPLIPDRKISVSGYMLWHPNLGSTSARIMSKHVALDWYFPIWNLMSFLILIISWIFDTLPARTDIPYYISKTKIVSLFSAPLICKKDVEDVIKIPDKQTEVLQSCLFWICFNLSLNMMKRRNETSCLCLTCCKLFQSSR